MGLFTGRSTEQPDEALPFLTGSAANDFRVLTREVFAELGLEVQIHPDHAVDDAGREFGFWNVATQCAEEPRRGWRRVIKEHVQAVLASLDGTDPFDGLTAEEAALHTYPRLSAEDAVPSYEHFPHREFAPGVVELLALDLPESVALMSHDHVRELGGWQQLRDLGVVNLQALPAEMLETVQAPGGGSFAMLVGDSFHTASRAVLLPGLAMQLTGERPPEHGWLMSIPNRHQVLWHFVRDATVIQVVNAMAHFTTLGHADAPGPISPHVYWWSGSTYEQLTRIDGDGALSIHPSPAFTDVLNRVVGDD